MSPADTRDPSQRSAAPRPLRAIRGAVMFALLASFGLVALPACKKKKPPEPDTPVAPAPGTTQRSSPSGAQPTFGFGDLPAPPTGPLFSTTTEAPFRTVAGEQFKQILLAMHTFHDANGGLPAGYADKTGKPGLSWRVALLPYLENEPLFKQFKLDEPWDSAHNKKLIAEMPAVYAPPRQRTFGYTFCRGFTGPNTWLPPQQPARPGQLLLGVKLTQIPDGASRTILVAEAFDAVIWTKPDEVQFTPGTAPKLGGVFNSGFNVGMADGSVKFVRKNINGQTLANAIQTNDGNVADLDN